MVLAPKRGLACRHANPAFDNDSPHKPVEQEMMYRDDTAGRPKAQQKEVDDSMA